jgi:hypothetical protein
LFAFCALQLNRPAGIYCILLYSTHGSTAPSGPGPPHSRGCTITLRQNTFGRIPLDGRSDRRRDLYLTTHNSCTRKISIHSAGFEPSAFCILFLVHKYVHLNHEVSGSGRHIFVSLHYVVCNRSTLDIGVLGYIGIV